MEVLADRSFEKDFKRLPDTVKPLVVTVFDTLRKLERHSIIILPQVTSMVGFKGFFRLKLGDYRLGFYFEDEVLHLSRVLHRKEIYRYFP